MCSSHPKKAETRMDKGLAADSEKEALYVHIRPPLGGRTKGVAATRLASPRVPPPPRAAPGVGHAAPGPLGCAPPCALTRTGTRYLPTKRGEGALGCFGWKFSKSAAGQGNWRVGKSKICPRGRRQFRARITHAPEGLSTPLWCGQVSYPGGEKAGPMHSLSTAFEEINRLARYRVLAPRVVTQNCAA